VTDTPSAIRAMSGGSSRYAYHRYLLYNPLLREPLRIEHVKPRLLGHWGTTPGLNFVYAPLVVCCVVGEAETGPLAASWHLRLLAYSSIAQAGYLLMGVAALSGSPQGIPALVYYAIAYAVTNIAAFAVVIAVQRERDSIDLRAFAGLGRRHPWWTATLILSLLSLVGIPPLSGFVGKLEVFSAAIDAGQAWLAAIAVVNTVISLFYYLRVIAPAVLDAPDDAPPATTAGRPLNAVLGLATAATVAVGVAAEPLLWLAERSVPLAIS